jgi:hypothetical protein
MKVTVYEGATQLTEVSHSFSDSQQSNVLILF